MPWTSSLREIRMRGALCKFSFFVFFFFFFVWFFFSYYSPFDRAGAHSGSDDSQSAASHCTTAAERGPLTTTGASLCFCLPGTFKLNSHRDRQSLKELPTVQLGEWL